jgi:putative heme-binding domain-containing protein
MNQRGILLLTVLTLGLAIIRPVHAQDDEYESLFNGEDLTGWSGDPEVWSVVDGAIVGRTTADNPIEANTFLIWEGGEVDNFQLELEFKLEGGNSGIQYRSKLLDADTWSVGGYQADMEAGPNFTGIMYDEQGRGILALRGQSVVIGDDGEKTATEFADRAELQKSIRSGEWNEYVITARKNNLLHTINGQLMSKTTDNQSEKFTASGILALQVHRGPPMTVRYRNIRLKRLDVPADRDESEAAQEEAEVEEEPEPSTATSAASLTVPKGFQVELVYSVPRREQSSWVSMTVDPQGRLITSSERGDLYRITPPAIGSDDRPVVEKLDATIGSAQGLLWAHDSLYAVVASGRRDHPQGLYRLRDTDGDDQLDDVQLLRRLRGEGEHGPHAVVLGPDGNDLYVVAGNHTNLTEIDGSRVPPVWDEDQVLPSMPDAGGHAVGIRAPGGWIARTDPDGKSWELVSIGYRNAYDIAFNADGELFTFDADMEWDIGAPWYRPTRVCHVTSGSEFGWRNGSGKWPVYYPDTLPAMLDMGPGSPTGVIFGYGAKFPQKYQQALYVCDWSFGAIEILHLQPNGGTYQATADSFVTGAPLPLTDIVVNLHDGAMYFTIGGRGTQSGLYRVTYIGEQSDAAPETETSRDATASLEARRRLEQYHGHADPNALDAAWPYLRHADRFVRFAARTAIESQPVAEWQPRALAETDATGRIEAAVALARCGDASNSKLPGQIVQSLGALDWASLAKTDRLALLRAHGLVLIRFPDAHNDELRAAIAAEVDPHFPAGDADLDRELCTLLVRVEAPDVVSRTLALQETAATQEEEIHYAKALRTLIDTASKDEQETYFNWFARGRQFRGGYSLRRYVSNIREEAAGELSAERREELADLINANDEPTGPQITQPTRPAVAEYTADQVMQIAEGGLNDRDLSAGRQLFAATQCFQCHRIGNEGGATGPDLTTLGRRFALRDVIEAVVEPDKFISDRFRQTMFTMADGRIVTGRVANHFGGNLAVVTDMLNPGRYTTLPADEVEESEPVDVSQMPTGLVNTLTEDELRDLLAYLLADRSS